MSLIKMFGRNMSSRNLLNLVLVVVVVALVLIVVYEPGKQEEASRLISNVDKALVTEISIERIGNSPIILSLVDKQWQMQAPYKMKANKIKAESLLDLLAYNYHARYDMAELDAKLYGLDLPRTTITFNKEYKFEFGSTEPLKNNRYIRFQNILYLTDDYFYHRILGAATSFLDHELLDAKLNITKIELPGLTLSLNDAKWEARPKPAKYSNDQANELVDHWKHSHAIEMLAYPPAKGTGQVRIYEDENKEPIRFDIFTLNDEFYLGRKDLNIAYKLANEKRRDLLQLPPAIETPAADPAVK